MKNIILVLALTICLTACENKNEDVVIDEQENNNSSIEITNKDENVEETEEKDVTEDVANKVEEKIEEKVEKRVEETLNTEKEYIKTEVESTESTPKYIIGVEEGEKATDFEVELLSGEKIELSDYLGKPVFLNFWATWCGPCVSEMPSIEKINKEYGDKLVILAINGGEDKEGVELFIDKKGYTFNIGVDEKGEVLGLYDSMYIPLSIFIDENGVIKKRVVGALSEEDMKTIVKDLIKEPPL